MIDHYCERVGPGLLAEPLNALSSLALLAVAVFGWRYLAADRGAIPGARPLTVLLGAVAIASLAWHGFATSWARWLDIAALLVFQLGWLWVYARQALGLAPRRAGLVPFAFGLSMLPAATQASGSNGLLLYLPTLAALLALGWHRRLRSMRAPNLLLGAAAIFALALALRTVDAPLCGTLPVGTHFAWHLLVALVAWLALRSLSPGIASAGRDGID